jgi:RNA polymerase sigma factor (TIGR02999 family)
MRRFRSNPATFSQAPKPARHNRKPGHIERTFDSMSGFSKNDVTLLLEAVAQGEKFAAEQLMPLIYDELRALAASQMAKEAAGHTLQPTALVHEAWLRLSKSGERRWNDRAHFLGFAAIAMRRILVDDARKKARIKRGKNPVRVHEIETPDLALVEPEERALLVDQALERLERIDPESAQIVTLKFFANYTTREIAGILNVGERTVERRWTYARNRLMQMVQEAT